MTPATLMFLCGCVVGGLATIVALFFASELRYRRDRPVLRSLTAEKRDDDRRFVRAVSSSVRTPLPFRPLKAKGAR